MRRKTLGLILGAGRGSRVQAVLTPDEPVKAMLKINEKRLIEHAIDFLGDSVNEKAVLTFPSPEYQTLDGLVQSKNIRVLKQKGKHKKLPSMLELPYLLFMQYYFSADKKFLKGFDSILTMPCDLVFQDVHIQRMLDFHYQKLKHPSHCQITFLASDDLQAERPTWFHCRDFRVYGMKSSEPKSSEKEYVASKQAGIYIFSKGMLRHLYRIMLGFRWNTAYRHTTDGSWIDFGDAQNVLKSRELP